MQFNKVFKGLLIALPVTAMMACSSGPSEAELEAERNRKAAAEQQAEADRLARERAARDAEQAKAAAAKRVMEIEERKKREMADLQEYQTIYFEFDRSNVRSDFYSILDKHATYLTNNPGVSIVIQGHTDKFGTPEYNIALGERRGQAVETYLQNAGVSGSQLSVVSFGEEKPASYGNTRADFAKNRRAVIVYK